LALLIFLLFQHYFDDKKIRQLAAGGPLTAGGPMPWHKWHNG